MSYNSLYQRAYKRLIEMFEQGKSSVVISHDIKQNYGFSSMWVKKRIAEYQEKLAEALREKLKEAGKSHDEIESIVRASVYGEYECDQ